MIYNRLGNVFSNIIKEKSRKTYSDSFLLSQNVFKFYLSDVFFIIFVSSS